MKNAEQVLSQFTDKQIAEMIRQELEALDIPYTTNQGASCFEPLSPHDFDSSGYEALIYCNSAISYADKYIGNSVGNGFVTNYELSFNAQNSFSPNLYTKQFVPAA